MPLDETLIVLVLRRLQYRVYEPAGAVHAPSDGREQVNGDLGAAHGPKTFERLLEANARAWTALEVALGGPTLWDKLQTAWGNADEDFCRRIRRFLDTVPLPDLNDADSEFREASHRELRAARTAGLLTAGSLELHELLRRSSELDHVADWEGFLKVEWEVLRKLAEELARAGFPNLSSALALRLQGDQPFLVTAVLYFFHHRAREDSAGNPGADLDGVDHLDPAVAEGFTELAGALERHGNWLEALLADLDAKKPPGGPPPAPEPPEPADAALQQAVVYFNQGEYDRAIASFSAVLRTDPENARAYACRGDAHRFRCEYDQAVADFTQAVRLQPENPQAYVSRGLIRRLQEDAAAAIADYTEALRHDPRNVVALNNRGIAHADRNEQDLAIADFTAALELDAQYFWAYHNRGKAYSVKSEYDAAIADHTRVLALNPNHAAVYTDRGDAYRLKGEYDRAIADYTAALQLDPQNARTYASLGDAYRLKGDVDRAIADYTEAIRLDPVNGEIACHRGIMYRLKGEFALAVADLNEALRLDPKTALAYYHRAKLYAAQGNLEEAVADYSEALWLQPGFSVFAYLDRALAYHRMGQLREVLVDCTKALRLNPNLGPGYFLRGTGYADWPDHEKAVADFTQAIALGPPFALAYQRRGLAYLQQGALESALADLAEAVRLDPRDPLTYAHRAVAYQLKGDPERAAVDLARAFRLDPELMLLSWTEGSASSAREVYVPQIADYIEGRLVSGTKAFLSPEETAPVARKSEPVRTSSPPSPAGARSESADRSSAEPPVTKAARETVCNTQQQDLYQTVPDRVPEPASPASEIRQETKEQPSGRLEAPTARKPANGSPNKGAVPPSVQPEKRTTPRPADPDDLPEDAQPRVRPPRKSRPQPRAPGQKTMVGRRRPAASAQETQATWRPVTSAASTANPDLTDAGQAEKTGPAPDEILGTSVECPECRYDFTPADVQEGGKVECARCQAVFVPEVKVQKEKPVTSPRPQKAEARPALVHRAPHGKKPSISLPPWAGVALVAVLVVGVGLIVLLRKPGQPTNKTPRLAATMTVDELCRTYTKDPAAANKKFAGQFVDVRGVVEQVFREGEPRLVLQTSKDAGFTVECFVGHVNDLAGVEPGQTVSVKGQCETRPKPGGNVKILMAKITLPKTPGNTPDVPDPGIG